MLGSQIVSNFATPKINIFIYKPTMQIIKDI